MSWEFFVGQKVVCVDALASDGSFMCGNLRESEIYTVVGLGAADPSRIPYKGSIKTLFLKETQNSFCGTPDIGYARLRFRPVEFKSTLLFRSIAQGVTDGKPVVPDSDAPVEIEPVMPEFVGRPLLSWNVRRGGK